MAQTKIYLEHWNGDYQKDYFAVKNVLIADASRGIAFIEMVNGVTGCVDYDEVIIEVLE